MDDLIVLSTLVRTYMLDRSSSTGVMWLRLYRFYCPVAPLPIQPRFYCSVRFHVTNEKTSLNFASCPNKMDSYGYDTGLANSRGRGADNKWDSASCWSKMNYMWTQRWWKEETSLDFISCLGKMENTALLPNEETSLESTRWLTECRQWLKTSLSFMICVNKMDFMWTALPSIMQAGPRYLRNRYRYRYYRYRYRNRNRPMESIPGQN